MKLNMRDNLESFHTDMLRQSRSSEKRNCISTRSSLNCLGGENLETNEYMNRKIKIIKLGWK